MTDTFVSREGKRVPDVAFRVRRNGDWATVTTDDIFARKNVVVFSLPGAFTPTCSSTHLPRFNELAPVFKAQGIDAIVCISVNDPFVMDEWGKDQEAANVVLLPDGNGEFTEKMGMLVDKSDLDFGKRSWRYSMLVRNRRSRRCSSSRRSRAIRSRCRTPTRCSTTSIRMRRKPDQVAILTREGCSFCAKAKQRLDRRRLRLRRDSAAAHDPHQGRRRDRRRGTVPQVFINGELIGGSAELEAYLRKAA